MTQYSKSMVLVHWLTLVMLAAAWFLGEELADATDENSATLAGYLAHLLIGGSVLLLTAARLYFRGKHGTPAPLGDSAMDKVAKGIHHMLYTVLFLLPVSGFVTVMSSDAARALSTGDASLLPKEGGYDAIIAHDVHEILVNLLIALVAVHVLGALKHQFVLKDGIMDRMMLRRKP